MSDRIAYNVLQTTMARQRVTVYDLYGLLGVSPNVDEDGLRAAYDSITQNLQQVPSDVINAAYSVLTNPFKRAQYDRDRLEYLYKQFSNHESFPPTTSIPAANIKGRDDQIQVYTATLVERVKDPIEDKKKAINRRIETIRNELDEFNETSGRQRQDWATSNNRVLRMAGNALCEVVVCAEEDLRMLEDEVGRIDGKLSPRDPDGPAGRVTSTGYYGSEIMAMPTGTATGTMMPPDSQPRVLMNRNVPSLPRSPTVRFLPQSASKLGVDGITKDTPSSEGSREAHEADGNDRVNDFLLGGTHGPSVRWRWDPNNNARAKAQAATHARAASLLEKLRQSTDLERVGADNNNQSPAAGGAMGLVAWQRLNGPGNPQDSPETARRTQSHPTDLTAYTKPYDPTHTQSADQLEPTRRPSSQLLDVPTPPPAAWRNSWDPAYSRGFDGGGPAAGAGGSSYGFNVARPAARGFSATASNTVLFKEVQDRAAALARAPARWVVDGPGLTNYDGSQGSSPDEKEKGPEDPFA
ncbi:heat shock protein binding [Diaporthe eres]